MIAIAGQSANPATGGPYESNPISGATTQGPLACEGVLPLHPRPIASNPGPTGAEGVRIAMISDGTSNTLMVHEVSWKGLELAPSSLRAWVRGIAWNNDATAAKNIANAINTVQFNGSNNFNDISFGSQHTGGANFALSDGSVRFVNNTISMGAYFALASRDGGEVVTE